MAPLCRAFGSRLGQLRCNDATWGSTAEATKAAPHPTQPSPRPVPPGLDSYTADSLTQTLKRVAAAGRVVVASLHQPSR